MGEDRVTFAEKKNVDVLPSRQRHSSVISSCSEDTESESTSIGYPPTPDEEKEEELEYGPGIVNKLRTRFLSISLKQNRGTNIWRSCSMENLLDQDRPSRSSIYTQNRFNVNGKDSGEHKNSIWGNLKRAKSMDTLLMDLQPEPPPISLRTEMKKEPKIIRRVDGGLHRSGPTICDEELPKPDTVKTYKRMFEPAESRRGSYSRRPPVLRASAKSGTLSVSKTNGVSTSAKINGMVSKSKLCAKQSDSESTLTNKTSNMTQPIVNGDVAKSMCNGSYVKATPIKIIDNSLCNGKTVEKEMNALNLNMSKNDNQSNLVNGNVCNGNSAQKELVNMEVNKEHVKPVVKQLLNQNNKVLNGNESGMKNIVNGINSKPKVPPNRPAFIKNVKPVTKIAELHGVEKKPLVSKLKPSLNGSAKKAEESIKPEINNKFEKNTVKDTKLNGEAQIDLKDKETKFTKLKEEEEIKVEEENRKNISNVDAEMPDMIHSEKPNSVSKGEVEKRVNEQVNGEVLDNEKPYNNHTLDTVDIKHESKPIKKQAASTALTTSMVFDFRGKDVVPHVAVLPVPFGCKALHPKKKALLIDGKEAPNGNGASDEEDEYYIDYSVPPPSGVTFEGENVKIGKGSILSKRNKELKIKFDDNVDDNTFVYPSESSMLDENDQSLSPTPSTIEPLQQNGQSPSSPSKLKTNTAIGTSGAGGLATYTPSVLRTMDNFEPSMFRPPPILPEKEEEKTSRSGEEENTEVRDDSQEQEMLKPADPGIISSWSLSAGTSDLLF